MTLLAIDAAQRSDARRCGFRGCSAALPPPTGRPGNRPKYCQDGRTWGPQALSCKAAEAAYLAVTSLQGDAPLPPDGVVELTDRLDAAAAPLRELLDAVTATGAQLQHDVLRAHAERDAALLATAADRGRREIAETDTAAAQEAASVARTEADSARAEGLAAAKIRDAAESRARDAERALLRGEGTLAALADRLRRAEELTGEASANAARLDTELADALATLRARDDELRRERARVEELRQTQRAELAARDTAAEHASAEQSRLLDELRAELSRRTDDLRRVCLADVDRLSTIHTAEVARLAAAHVAAQSETRREHEVVRAQLEERAATLYRGLGVVEHERDRLAVELAGAVQA